MITFISGLMKGGKSEALMNIINVVPYQDCLILKPSVDTRNGSFVTSRAKNWKAPAIMVDEKDDQLVTLIFKGIDKYKYVFIDEVQFFSPEFVLAVMGYCYTFDVELVMSGLTYDVFGGTFPTAKAILEQDVESIFLRGNCDICDELAEVDIRVIDGKIDTSGEVLVVEGSSEAQYLTVCHKCKSELC